MCSNIPDDAEVFELPENFTCKAKGSGIISKTVTKQQAPWLPRDLEEGSLVFKYTGETFDCISPSGIAICMYPNKFPFYEIPANSVVWDNG